MSIVTADKLSKIDGIFEEMVNKNDMRIETGNSIYSMHLFTSRRHEHKTSFFQSTFRKGF